MYQPYPSSGQPAAVWLLWRPASSAFFKPQRFI
jgi:hypothetical protein